MKGIPGRLKARVFVSPLTNVDEVPTTCQAHCQVLRVDSRLIWLEWEACGAGKEGIEVRMGRGVIPWVKNLLEMAKEPALYPGGQERPLKDVSR